MFRLIALTAAGLYATLAYYGTPAATAEVPQAVAAAAPASVPAAPVPAGADASGARVIAAALTQPAPAAPVFAGPRLQPSPEHAGPAAAAQPESAEGALYVTAAGVNLRAGPGTEHPRLDALTLGTPLVAVGPTTGAWIEVRDPAGAQGFVSARFLSANRPG